MSEFAWVTLATNDSYSLGALVLAHSLKQVGTKHQLAVLITPGVTSAMREKLTAVFNLVEEVNPLDSKDAANLKLLKRPELGITFTKLHCWRLVQFQKCVFLDADTLVLSNSDELFDREEFSAAPDVGWPDCFNSGVFVYKPSNETYSKLVDFALVKGSFDGGDQGLLNLYFSDWAHKDIAKHLPFIYNMCSTAVYSYLPAFKQYGKNAKIVHFIGPAKPWLQYFNTENLTVYPSPGLQHLEDVLQKWWNIFCSLIHPNLSRDMSGLAGAFAQFTLGAKRSAGQDALENHLRRQAWEVGNIDYLGRDSFDHIWTKICESMSAPVRESVPQPTAESKVETKAVEAIGDIPTADTIQEISCTAGPVQAAEEKPSLPKPDVEPPKVETTSVVAEELKPLEVSAQTIPEGVPPVVLKQPEVTEVPKTDEPAPSEEPKIVTQPPSIAPQEPAVLASTDIAPTSPAPGITAGETPKVADIQTTQAVETTLAVLVETGKVDVPTGTPTDLPKLEATVQDSLPSEAPKTEAAPGKIETPSTESPKIEPEPTKTEAASKPDTPVTEPIPTTPSEVKTPETTQAETPKSEPIKVGEIVSTIVTPPTPTDATKTDTPISEDVPQIISPAVPSETTPTPEPIPLPQPIPLTEPIAADVPKSEVDQQKEVPMEGVPAVKTASEPQKQEDVIPKEPAIAAEVPKKAEDSVLKKDDQVEKKEECPVKTEEVKSEPIPSEILQSAEVVALKETETPKVEAEVPKVESEAPKVEAETLKTEAEAPKVEVEAQKVETISPKLEAEAPKVEAETPKVAAEVPKVEPEAPKVETVIPKAGTETPKVEAEPLKVEAEVPKVEVEATKVEAEVPKVEGEALKVEPETPKAEVEVSKPGETAEQKAEGTKPEGAEGVQEKPKKKIVKKVKKVPKTEAGGPKAEAASSEEQPEVAGGETSMPTPPPRKTTTVKKVKAKKP